MVNITARDISSILGMNPFEDAWTILETKVERKHHFVGNKFTEHGRKYEKAAIIQYEEITRNIVDSEQQNQNHSQIPWITGRVDGVTQNGCIIEVKCPWRRRKETLTPENVPLHYWVQCQAYMNILDVEVTHYIEYYVKSGSPTDGSVGFISYIPINRDRDWWDKIIPNLMQFYEEMNKWLDKGSLTEHPIRTTQLDWQEKFKL